MRRLAHGESGARCEELERRVVFDAAFGGAREVYSERGTTEKSADVAFADFDGDGVTDMAVASGRAVRFLRGNGDGTFAGAVTTMLGSRVGKIAAGNFDGAGGADLAAVGNAGHVGAPSAPADAVGKGYFIRVLSYDAAFGGLALRARRFVEITTERREGSEGFADGTSVLAANVMGGGRDEIAVRVMASGVYVPERTVVWVFATPGAAGGAIDSIALRSTVLDTPVWGAEVASGDINGDGRADVLFRPRKVWRAELYPRAGTWEGAAGKARITIAGSTDGTPGYRGGEALNDSTWADVDGDGRVDRVRVLPTAGARQDGSVYASAVVTRGEGDGRLGAEEVQTGVVLPASFAVAPSGALYDTQDEPLRVLVGPDLNGDGRIDLVVGKIGALADSGTHELFAYDTFATLSRNGLGTFDSAPFRPAENAYDPTGVVDVDNDGRPDLVTLVENSERSEMSVYVQPNVW